MTQRMTVEDKNQFSIAITDSAFIATTPAGEVLSKDHCLVSPRARFG